MGKPTPIRLEDEQLARADRVREVMEKRVAGAEVSRASVIRIAIDRGLELLEKEFGVPKKSKHK